MQASASAPSIQFLSRDAGRLARPAAPFAVVIPINLVSSPNAKAPSIPILSCGAGSSARPDPFAAVIFSALPHLHLPMQQKASPSTRCWQICPTCSPSNNGDPHQSCPPRRPDAPSIWLLSQNAGEGRRPADALAVVNFANFHAARCTQHVVLGKQCWESLINGVSGLRYCDGQSLKNGGESFVSQQEHRQFHQQVATVTRLLLPQGHASLATRSRFWLGLNANFSLRERS